MSSTVASARTAAELLGPTDLAAWRGFLRAHAALTKVLDAELQERHGLPLAHYEVLMHLSDAPDGRLRMRELAEAAILSRSGLTRLADRLERDGSLRRVPCPDDGRGSFAEITPSGRERVGAARTTHLAGVRRLYLSHFSEAERERLGAWWAGLIDAVQPGAQP